MMWCTLKTACVSCCVEGSGSECVVLFAEASGHEIDVWLEAGAIRGFRVYTVWVVFFVLPGSLHR